MMKEALPTGSFVSDTWWQKSQKTLSALCSGILSSGSVFSPAMTATGPWHESQKSFSAPSVALLASSFFTR